MVLERVRTARLRVLGQSYAGHEGFRRLERPLYMAKFVVMGKEIIPQTQFTFLDVGNSAKIWRPRLSDLWQLRHMWLVVATRYRLSTAEKQRCISLKTRLTMCLIMRCEY